MNRNFKHITSSQFATFIMSAQIGIGILSLPAILAKEIGHDGWISVLITGALFSLAGCTIVLLLHRYEDKSILEINQLLYTKKIAHILNLVITVYLFFASSLGLRAFTEVINVSILKLSSGIIIATLLILPTIHMSWYGLKTICRFDRILLFIMLVVVLFLMLFLDNARLTFIMPVGQAGISKIMSSMVLTSFAFLGIELTCIIYPNISDKKKLMKSMIIANISTTLFFLIIIVMLTTVFGEEMLKQMVFPLFNLAQAYKPPVLERLDLFFISTWLPAMEISITAYYYSTLHCLEKLFVINKRFRLHLLFSIAVILASRIPNDLNDTYGYSNKLNKFGLIVIAFLMFSFIFSYINKNGVTKK